MQKHIKDNIKVFKKKKTTTLQFGNQNKIPETKMKTKVTSRNQNKMFKNEKDTIWDIAEWMMTVI